MTNFTRFLSDPQFTSFAEVAVSAEKIYAIDPAACVMVGDTDHDAAVAAAIGATCVLYTGGHQSRALLEAACPHVIDDLALLPDLLESL